MTARRLFLSFAISLFLHGVILASFPQRKIDVEPFSMEIHLQHVAANMEMAVTKKNDIPLPQEQPEAQEILDDVPPVENKVEPQSQINPYAMFSRMTKMNFLVGQTRRYMDAARARINAMMSAAWTAADRKRFDGKKCEMKLNLAEGNLAEISCDDAELEKILSGMSWADVPKPQDYSLSFKVLEIGMSISAMEAAIGIKSSD